MKLQEEIQSSPDRVTEILQCRLQEALDRIKFLEKNQIRIMARLYHNRYGTLEGFQHKLEGDF